MKRTKRVFRYSLKTIAKEKGVSLQAVMRARRLGILDPESFRSIGEYLGLKRGHKKKEDGNAEG